MNEITRKKVKNPKSNRPNWEQEATKKGHNYNHRSQMRRSSNYIKEASRQKSDKNYYKTLQTNLTLQQNKIVNDTI